jgi:hypothetical protein
VRLAALFAVALVALARAILVLLLPALLLALPILLALPLSGLVLLAALLLARILTAIVVLVRIVRIVRVASALRVIRHAFVLLFAADSCVFRGTAPAAICSKTQSLSRRFAHGH